MTFAKHNLLFIQSNLKKLQRKWLSLPLLLLFPVLLISLIAVIAVSIFLPEESEPIHVGLVDLDKSQETETVINLIEESSKLGSFIKMEALSETEANERINGQLSAYVSFPEGFTESLYSGDSVTLNITGNPDKQTESHLVKELLDSIARHIRTSQANILTVNYYAKQLSIDSDTRHDMLFQQFNNFLVYTAGKDKIVDEEQISNDATSSPVDYYSLAAWFMILTIWLLTFYSFFTNDEQVRMQNRMRLYGVTILQQLTAKITITFILTSIFAGIVLYTYTSFMAIPLYGEDYGRIVLITGLYSLIYLIILAILELIFTGQKLRLLIQSLFTLIVLLASGAIIPTLYFPMYMQNLLPYFFASEGYHWLQEILLNNRLYADYIPLTIMLAAAVMMLLGTSAWKESAR
ncbi:MAG TPA: ABC transporter permease [Lentibacillus sp.]|uniref:ABC transporter permease n=1 Tax=Lentibacillus sp. TaxID=1925746 RepID=UPI002B4B4059|nr:ABC transporter permease [Lentibacillus sp.]HLR62658.1 ABC transporter permease [Lentibacillus sp.]